MFYVGTAHGALGSSVDESVKQAECQKRPNKQPKKTYYRGKRDLGSSVDDAESSATQEIPHVVEAEGMCADDDAQRL
jgi:hypothetical protein